MTSATLALLLHLIPIENTVASLELHEFERREMGVRFRTAFYAPSACGAIDAANQAFARIRALNHVFSDYEPESEAMRLCRAGGMGNRLAVSAELFFVLTWAEHVARESSGAFDVTVGPLAWLWREARRQGEAPSRAALEEARTRTGWRHVRLYPEECAVELLRADMGLDFGAIAKGYAADQALEVLARHGIDRALVAADGDIAVSGPPPDRLGWRIGIAPFDEPEGVHSVLLEITYAAVATSGDAWQHAIIEGRRRSHILDPRSGEPLEGPTSVTVVARTGMLADALATAASVLGPESGLTLLARYPGTEALMSRIERRGLRVIETRGLRAWRVH